MTIRGDGPDRRALLRGTVALGLPAACLRPRRAAAAPPRTASLLTPGPEGGPLLRQGRRITAVLSRALPTPEALVLTVVGGPDGVTAANRFAAEAAPDGRTMLLLPGETAQAWLVGDPRARFDPSGWTPVCATERPAMVVGRGALQPGAQPRFALSSPAAPEAVGLLALDLAGVPARPVPLLGLSVDGLDAFAQGAVDALVVRDETGLRQARGLGGQPWLALCERSETGGLGCPTLTDLAAIAPPEPMAACRAAAASLRLRSAVVLPSLTPADTVAFWRRAAQRFVENEAREVPDAVALEGTAAAAALGVITPLPEAKLAYREWLLRRLEWSAG
ncbi:hypothetical protein M0638_18480 [Roseomonas sp. NAR14]|uniref:Tripartite-type tricarboxylate transporter receptor subunit TctC n=1 Tax=Roseomonas acroporae TaxID=2937791 RepID=A0A9X1YAX9_9PROT|nr:hypothetical protein [Roseomonas acroporae]MCK8786367.1 hypothetical protein [Roseomonas acroporae]